MGEDTDPAFGKRVEAFELYVHARVLRLSWGQQTMDREVLHRIEGQPMLLSSVKA